MSAQARSQMISTFKRPQFQGQPERWEAFKNDWREYWELVETTRGTQIQKLQLEFFRQCLDQSTQRMLALEKLKTPGISFWDFWSRLDDLYGADHSSSYREQWRQVKLSYKGPKVTLADSRKFRTNFELAKLKVLDWTPDEERTLIRDQLPPALLSEVVKEDHRAMGQRNTSLRVPQTPGVTMDMLLTLLCSVWELDNTNPLTMHMLQKCITEDGYGWLIECSRPYTRWKALTLDEMTFKGVTIPVCKFENRLTGETIFNRIEDRLKQDEELWYLIRTCSKKGEQAHLDEDSKGHSDVFKVSKARTIKTVTHQPTAQASLSEQQPCK